MNNEIICEAECPACGAMVKFYELGWTICPVCESIKAELTVGEWVIIKDKKDE